MRHDLRPGRLVAGLALILTAVVYFGDAGDAWQSPWWVAFPLVGGGLVVAGVVGVIARSARRRPESTPPADRNRAT
ncbi:hypothetical protein [Streptomyces beihaiensis]|uniref:Integral membrane protein n=1 Tax=Streptomyces beihaiensis TaxID=2984495 RepID=A0ABT3TMW7_9ACTN|nr:hypothetical protein [Streptomyces beihaiensis]MCX3058384.1 hypothetical protein [Streptomyces beihaiensis]